jgi:hypothetical protein
MPFHATAIPCDGGGLIYIDHVSSYTIDAETGDLIYTDQELLTFDNCTQSVTEEQDGVSCTITTMLGGEMTCYQEILVSDEETSGSLNCYTASDCAGLTVTDEDNVAVPTGLNMVVPLTGNPADLSTPISTGSVCVEGNNFDLGDFSSNFDLEVVCGE